MAHWMRRIGRGLAWIVLAIVVLVGGAALALWMSGHSGRTAVETWIGHQLLKVANNYLGPQLSFDKLEYQYPRTVKLTKVRLTADDLAVAGSAGAGGAGGRSDILSVDALTLELAEIPERGKPLHIQQLKLDKPVLRMISTPQGFVGFSHLLRSSGSEPPAAPTPATATTSTAEDLRLSSVFQIQMIELHDGRVTYEQPGQPTMELDQINTHMDIKAATTQEGQAGEGTGPGWYAINLTMKRDPVFNCQINGKMNLDTAVLDLDALKLAMTLGRDQDHYLPSALQTILRNYEVSGQLQIDGHGKLVAADWTRSQLATHLQLAKGQFALGTHRWPVESLDMVLSLAQQQGKLESLKASLLGGTVQANSAVSLAAGHQGQASLRLSDIKLEQTLRSPTGDPSEMRGKLGGQIDWQGPLDAVMTQSRGNGSFNLVDGQLAPIPGVGTVLDALKPVMKFVGMSAPSNSDTGDVAFTIQGDHANITKLDVSTAWATLHGQGNVYFDGRLNMQVNGGPLEKGESLLGGFGKTLSRATNELSQYTITGTVDHPQVGLSIVPGLRFP